MDQENAKKQQNLDAAILARTKRILIENPDGSYQHGVREGEHDSLMEEVKSENSSYGSMDDESMLAGLDFTFEDIRLFVDDWNAPNLSQQILQLYLRHRLLFFLFLLFDLLCEAGVLLHTWFSKDDTIEYLMENSRSQNRSTVYYTFLSLFIVDIFIDVVYFTYANVALKKESIRLLKHTACLAFVQLFAKLIFTYISTLNILLMITKLIGLVYAKFITALIQSIITYPPAF